MQVCILQENEIIFPDNPDDNPTIVRNYDKGDRSHYELVAAVSFNVPGEYEAIATAKNATRNEGTASLRTVKTP